MADENSSTLSEKEKAMQWERMSGERLSDAERARIEAGGAFHLPEYTAAKVASIMARNRGARRNRKEALNA